MSTVEITSGAGLELRSEPITFDLTVPTDALSGSNTYSGPITIGAAAPLEYMPDYRALRDLVMTLRSTLAGLIVSVKAGEPCRCYKTEVCPACDTLDKDVAASEALLQATAAYGVPPRPAPVELGGAFITTGGTSIPGVQTVTTGTSSTLTIP